MFRKLCTILIVGLVFANAYGQKLSPVSWTFANESFSGDTLVFVAKAKLMDNWSIYSQHTEYGGPVGTAFTFEAEDAIIGETEEVSEVITKYSDLFEINVSYFKGEAIFKQKYLKSNTPKTFKGKVLYMSCDDEKCLPPTYVDFELMF